MNQSQRDYFKSIQGINMGANGIKQFYANPMTDGLTPKQRVFQLINGENKNGKFGMNGS
jgi:hypothetical protein